MIMYLHILGNDIIDADRLDKMLTIVEKLLAGLVVPVPVDLEVPLILEVRRPHGDL